MRRPCTQTSRDLDISLALTAHELRGPLLSVKAAIETSLFDENPIRNRRR